MSIGVCQVSKIKKEGGREHLGPPALRLLLQLVSWFSAWVLLPRAEMILAFLIVNNFGKARMLKFYRETVRVPFSASCANPVAADILHLCCRLCHRSLSSSSSVWFAIFSRRSREGQKTRARSLTQRNGSLASTDLGLSIGCTRRSTFAWSSTAPRVSSAFST